MKKFKIDFYNNPQVAGHVSSYLRGIETASKLHGVKVELDFSPKDWMILKCNSNALITAIMFEIGNYNLTLQEIQ